MISRRRLTLQLTPLLDMLLIVVFLQYFQLRDREQSLAGEQQAIVTERSATQSQITELVQNLDALRQQLSYAETQASQARQRAVLDRQTLIQSQSTLQHVVDQQQVIGQLVHELFQIPPDDIQQLLNSTRGPGGVQTPADREKIMQRFRQLASGSPGKILEHLLSYEEIRKRCDVWTLHLEASGVATLSDGIRSRSLRVPMQDDGEVLREQFVAELFTWYRTLPQTKSLVVILLTYDRNSRIYLTESVRAAMPVWVGRMQADSAGRSRFEYADLGFRLE